MKTTLGGDRIGSGSKEQISMREYSRSTHDLGYEWRSTMASGTLVPFMCEVILPGDTMDIDLEALCMTHPTIGPLFGSYKIQLDTYLAPVRLYQKRLHMNEVGIGLKMQDIKLPQVLMEAKSPNVREQLETAQINPSCLFAYLGIQGLGSAAVNETIRRYFNAVPWLAYWEIYKNYYANKQEEIGVVIHNPLNADAYVMGQVSFKGLGGSMIDIDQYENPPEIPQVGQIYWQSYIMVAVPVGREYWKQENFYLWCQNEKVRATDLFQTVEEFQEGWIFKDPVPNLPYAWMANVQGYYMDVTPVDVAADSPLKLREFPLSNIDEMRTRILETHDPMFEITEATDLMPYNLPLRSVGRPGITVYSKQSGQEGLGIKTYQSDLFNNWVSNEWIDGAGGINEITAVDTSSGSFNMDELALSKKVWEMLNRIAVSGGSYDDWLDAVYTHKRTRATESPMYMGGMQKELIFQEVVSTAGDGSQPLGTLAGKGRAAGGKKGGHIKVRADEPSYVIGIVSLTPRIDYSGGNRWDVNLKTMNDFHKPALDAIGFQDLITDQMNALDTNYVEDDDRFIFKSAGKQPAWINYMTNYNRVYGNFAIKSQQMFMTLNRRYELEDIPAGRGLRIKDLTTYIDPAKFNHIFADTRLDSQNFWMQIEVKNTARRLMSAKIIPNL